MSFWGEMLSRKASLIQVKVEDKDELEEARKRAAASSAASTGAGVNTLLHHFDQASKDSSSKSSRIGLS